MNKSLQKFIHESFTTYYNYSKYEDQDQVASNGWVLLLSFSLLVSPVLSLSTIAFVFVVPVNSLPLIAHMIQMSDFEEWMTGQY